MAELPLHNSGAKDYAKDSKSYDLNAIMKQRMGPTYQFLETMDPEFLAEQRALLGQKLSTKQNITDKSDSEFETSSKVPIGKQAFFDAWNMVRLGLPAYQKQEQSIADTRGLVGGLMGTIKKNPAIMADWRPLGRMIERMDPQKIKGLSTSESHSPWKIIEAGMDLNKTLLDAQNAMSGRESQMFSDVMMNKIAQKMGWSGQDAQETEVVDSNPHMPVNTPTGTSAGESRARKEAQEAMSAPETSAVYENMKIIEGITSKYPEGKLPGVGRAASMVPEGAMSMYGAVFKDPSMSDGIRLRSAARDMLAAYIASVSGKVTNREEYNRLSKILLMSTPASEAEWKRAFNDFNHKFASQLRAKIGTVSPAAKDMIDDMPPEVIRPDDLDSIQLKSGKKAPTGKSSLRDDLRRAKAKK
jgi:hypothetical protein